MGDLLKQHIRKRESVSVQRERERERERMMTSRHMMLLQTLRDFCKVEDIEIPMINHIAEWNQQGIIATQQHQQTQVGMRLYTREFDRIITVISQQPKPQQQQQQQQSRLVLEPS
jgi:hypothetical protein